MGVRTRLARETPRARASTFHTKPSFPLAQRLLKNGKTRQIAHGGLGKWSLAPGSQGIISGGSIEQTVEQISRLAATGWVARNMTEPDKYGFKPDNLQITIELKDGKKLMVDFGAPIANQSALASVMLDGERWTFVRNDAFPAELSMVLNCGRGTAVWRARRAWVWMALLPQTFAALNPDPPLILPLELCGWR